jgi:hypothetical protein
MKKNCWEFTKCGRETGGRNAVEKGICPAAVSDRYDGVHAGKNAGRACWAVAGTFCRGESQGTFAQKFRDCRACEFYKVVVEEEGSNFQFTATIHAILGRP